MIVQSYKVLLELGEIFPAVETAEKAVQCDLTWSAARQALGRAQLGLGELEMVSWDIFVTLIFLLL